VEPAPNQLFDFLGVFTQFVIPEPHDAKAVGFQPSRTSRIILDLKRVLTTIKLKNQSSLETDEVSKKRPERYLAAKLEMREAAIAKLAPEQAFLVGRALAELSRAFNSLAHCLSSSPLPLRANLCPQDALSAMGVGRRASRW
jgi:hypothetical protein